MSIKKQTVKKDSPLNRVLAQRTGEWLKAGIDDWLEQSAEFRYDPGWFHPSSLAHQCDAFLAFAYMGTLAQGKSAARIQRILDNGTSRDRDWKRYLNHAGLSVFKHWDGPEASAERYIEIPHVKIRGEMDDMVYNKITNELYIHEFKTMKKEDWEPLRGPLQNHVIQVHPYMFAKGVLQTIITYENKNNQDIKQFVVKFDGSLWHSLEVRLLNIIEMVENKQLPWRNPVQYETSCQFYHTCASYEFKE
jgi:hypothetical protein